MGAAQEGGEKVMQKQLLECYPKLNCTSTNQNHEIRGNIGRCLLQDNKMEYITTSTFLPKPIDGGEPGMRPRGGARRYKSMQ